MNLDRLKYFFEVSLSMLCTADATTNTFVDLNPAWERTLGWTLDELRSRPFVEFIHPDDLAPTFATITDMVQHHLPAVNFENRYRHKDGSWVWLSWYGIVRDGTFYSSATDISAYKRARAGIEEKAAQLALTSKYKSEFLANMSHELRTPLNSILILSQILGENPEENLAPKQVEYAKTVHSSGVDLLSLINDILDLSKIESGKAEVNISPIPFSEFFNFMEQTFRPVAISKTLDFQIDLDASLPSAIETDEKRLQQIIKNLLSNAFKFTERGKVTLRIAHATAGFNSNHAILNRARQVIAFSVTDTGIGIPENKHQIIFHAFQQADIGTGRKYGGTGLGLSISAELARLLGGEIKLASKSGQGSAFTLYLPAQAEECLLGETALFLRQVEANLPEPTRQILNLVHKQDTLLSGKKILIVDDDVRNIFSLTALLECRNAEIISAKNGREAIEIVQKTAEIDLILMDIMMPEMDGYETMRILRGMGKKLPIIAVTAKAMKGDREKCIEAGASDYIAKPVDIEQLLSLLRVFLYR